MLVEGKPREEREREREVVVVLVEGEPRDEVERGQLRQTGTRSRESGASPSERRSFALGNDLPRSFDFLSLLVELRWALPG